MSGIFFSLVSVLIRDLINSDVKIGSLKDFLIPKLNLTNQKYLLMTVQTWLRKDADNFRH